MTEPFIANDSVSASPFSVVVTVKMATGSVVFVLCLILGRVSETIAVDDSYIAGYAAAVLQQEFNATAASLLVQNGVVTVDAGSLGPVDRSKVQTALESITGVVRVEIREGQAHTDVTEPPLVQQKPVKPGSKFLPRGLLVAPFHADPRWPHFSSAYRRISVGNEPEKTGSANFG